MSNGWVRTDRVMRWLHLYTGLFLVPWMIVYALSALFLGHHQLIVETFDITPPQWNIQREVDFTPDDTFPHMPLDQAKAILQILDLDGPHRIVGKPNKTQLVIWRGCARGNYRITWRKPKSIIIVEQQTPFSFYRLVHFLHFQSGYSQKYPAKIVWAVMVDAAAISMLLWVVSGIYIWARVPPKRLLGGICLFGGIALFILLVLMMCN